MVWFLNMDTFLFLPHIGQRVLNLLQYLSTLLENKILAWIFCLENAIWTGANYIIRSFKFFIYNLKCGNWKREGMLETWHSLVYKYKSQVQVAVIDGEIMIKYMGAQILQKYRSNLKILGARRVTWSQFHTEDPQLVGARDVYPHGLGVEVSLYCQTDLSVCFAEVCVIFRFSHYASAARGHVDGDCSEYVRTHIIRVAQPF